MTKHDQGDFAAFDFDEHEAIADRWLRIGDVVRALARCRTVERKLIAACLHDVVFDAPDGFRDDESEALDLSEAAAWARRNKRPLTPTERRRADAITFGEDPRDQIVDAWNRLDPQDRRAFLARVAGRVVA